MAGHREKRTLAGKVAFESDTMKINRTRGLKSPGQEHWTTNDRAVRDDSFGQNGAIDTKAAKRRVQQKNVVKKCTTVKNQHRRNVAEGQIERPWDRSRYKANAFRVDMLCRPFVCR